MRILICPDKFKDSLSAEDVCAAIMEGVSLKNIDVQFKALPLADGGEGTCDLLTRYHHGQLLKVTVAGPLFTPVVATYGITPDGTAFIEMAKASGLALIPAEKRNPLITTTVGTGELIRDAIDRGVSQVVMGIGGSATNDGGTGMASALGFEFLDGAGNPLQPIGENLNRLHSVRDKNAVPRLKDVSFVTLCDVDNPLHGPNGAAHIYGPQKGADPQAVQHLDDGLRNFEKVIRKQFDRASNFPGAGAAGGLGAGAHVFLNSAIEKGFDYIVKTVGLSDLMRDADVVITGEGKVDQQSLSGKVVIKVSQMASRMGKPVIVICGKNEVNESDLKAAGIRQIISLADERTGTEDAMHNAYALIVEKIRCNLRL